MTTQLVNKGKDNPTVDFHLPYLRLHQEFNTKYAHMEEKFTERELQIINLLALGHNNGEIAEQLLISKHTVHTHRKNIYKKGNFKKIRDVVLFSLFFSKPLPA